MRYIPGGLYTAYSDQGILWKRLSLPADPLLYSAAEVLLRWNILGGGRRDVPRVARLAVLWPVNQDPEISSTVHVCHLVQDSKYKNVT